MITYIVTGIVVLIILVVLFGDKVDKKWEREVSFHNEEGIEVGEFEIELKKNSNLDQEHMLYLSFKIKHTQLKSGDIIHIKTAGQTILSLDVRKDGKARHSEKHPESFQVCEVLIGDNVLVSGKFIED